jgi:2-oxoglutarate dehydrogenase E1 component
MTIDPISDSVSDPISDAASVSAPVSDAGIDFGFANIAFAEEMYAKYQRDPSSVDRSWERVFSEAEKSRSFPTVEKKAEVSEAIDHPQAAQPLGESSSADIRVYNLIEAYRTYGHLMAEINPIQTHQVEEPQELKLESHGLAQEDLARLFPSYGIVPESSATLQKIIDTLKAIYCKRIGIEYKGLQTPEVEKWLQDRIEPSLFKVDLSIEQKQRILHQLNKSELLESFLHTKYVGQKRFSLEGGETLIPMLAALIETGAQLGIEELVVGMAHRGRLNVLSNILNKSYTEVFAEFDESYISNSYEGSGDVKYHKGFTAEIQTESGRKVCVDLMPNPSHLEAIDPVVEGETRAKQGLIKDEIHDKIMPILIHGDAAIAGQGVVYETLQLSKLRGYCTGGTLHFVINNQIGFTTLPCDTRSTLYCTDIAKGFGAPVFHVNAEDPEGCVYVTNLAVELRQKFHCDVFIDLNCYRKYGHNESDEPAFTQPLEYQLIRKKKPIREIYRDELIRQGILEHSKAEEMEAEFKKDLQQALVSIKPIEKKEETPSLRSDSDSNAQKDSPSNPIDTSVPQEILKEISGRVCLVPSGFGGHPKLLHLLKERLSMVMDEDPTKPIDWGMGETLAYGSLLWEGVNVRISGQDSCRGTFSHRHAMLKDQVQENDYYPLKNLKTEQGTFDIYNSPLSEYAALGYELGYTLGDPEALVIWEAQFGDFANGAQLITDQFLVSGEQKWGQKSGLVLYLPHGYEGQGPDHSSGRIERFLQLAGQNNIRVVNPTLPSQLFHLLRRQALDPIRKPLVVFTPKGLLRHPDCISRLEDFSSGAFQEILDDPAKPAEVKRLVFCSGRIFYDVNSVRLKMQPSDIACIRIEQLYPLNRDKLVKMIEKYTPFQECIWLQEEPANMGAYEYIKDILQGILPNEIRLKYIGRPRSGTTAVGSHALHKREHDELMKTLFTFTDKTKKVVS